MHSKAPSTLEEEVKNALFSKEPIFAESLDRNDPVRKLGDDLGGLFTEGVAFLKNVFPNPALNKLGQLIWDIVGHRLVLLGVGPNVPTMSFTAYVRGGVMQSVIFVPPFWSKMIAEDPMMQFGAIVFNGSKAVDFYNSRKELDGSAEGSKALHLRAMLYEAEFLRTLQQKNPAYAFNTYQQQVLAKYPNGLESPEADRLLYESKPFFVPTA